ncbi:MAG TPA: DUF4157 domain-containing protein [Blastocatellia bacterium]|nr:DUF4157 domain-containing protein [Blastocatellia bacterium]
MTKFRQFFAAGILTFCLLLTAVSLTLPAPAFAQGNCNDLNQLMNFDYRTWGIGVHRSCGLDPICLTLQAKQIAAGVPVQAWILASREAALSAGVQPMPAHIRTQLAHLYPASLLDSVRFKTGSGFLGSLQWFRSEMEGKGAITLKDVIVFANADAAQCNVRLWAHELEHIRQYGNLGVDGFAQAYVDQTCILPGDTALGGYDSGQCQLERFADRKMAYFDQRALALRCTGQKAPAEIILSSCPLNRTEEFIASDSIKVGPNVLLQPMGNVTLRAGRIITMSPGFRSEPGGKLLTSIEPSLR